VRRAFVLSALLLLAACGKSRVSEDPRPSWDDAIPGNGFHEVDEACSLACTTDDPPSTYATRTSPTARTVTSLEIASAGLVFAGTDCLAVALRGPMLDGLVACSDPDDGHARFVSRIGIPSALAYTDRIWSADRDVNGSSQVFAGSELVVHGEKDVRTLVAHRGGVYWIDGNERIRAVREPGAHVETAARAPHLDARFLAVDDNAFFVVRGASLVRVSRKGERDEILAVAQFPIADVVLSGGWLYWTEVGDARLVCNPDGTKPRCEGRGRRIVHPHGTLSRVRVSAPDSAPQVLAKDLEDADGILVVHSFVYASTRRGLVRVPLVLGGAPTMLPTPGSALGRPVLDTVSWTLFVQSRPKPGSSAVEIVAVVP
jgi:hypothetical protein